MAFNSIPAYSTTAGSNTDIGGVSIAEGFPAANINNSMRQLLAQLKTECALGANVASASTVDISTTHACRITGTTTITAFTITDGTTRFLTFSGALTITHDATNLICPGGANITTAAGDACIVEGIGANQARIVSYMRAAGTPLVAPTVTPVNVAVRQTVLSGPVDSNGQSAFGGATGSSTVTATGTLIATAANGFSLAAAGVNRVGSITNPSWTGLNTNGTMYLYLDIAADGTCTTGSTTLAPVYQEVGTYSTTSGQFTFNTSEMVGKVGNGSAANQTYRVFVGQVTVASNVVSAITWYALMGRYCGPLATAPASGADFSVNHNLGIQPRVWTLEAECITAANGFSPGAVIGPPFFSSGSTNHPGVQDLDRLSAAMRGFSGVSFYIRSSTATLVNLASNASYGIRFVVDRGW